MNRQGVAPQSGQPHEWKRSRLVYNRWMGQRLLVVAFTVMSVVAHADSGVDKPTAVRAVQLADRAWLDVAKKRVIVAEAGPMRALSVETGDEVWTTTLDPLALWLSDAGLVTRDKVSALDDLAFTVLDPDTGAVRGSCHVALHVPSAATILAVTATATPTGLHVRWETSRRAPRYGNAGSMAANYKNDARLERAARRCGTGDVVVTKDGCTITLAAMEKPLTCTGARLPNPRLHGNEVDGLTLRLESSQTGPDVDVALVVRAGKKTRLRVAVDHVSRPPSRVP